jgi:hypothetical protein
MVPAGVQIFARRQLSRKKSKSILRFQIKVLGKTKGEHYWNRL